MNSLHLHFAIFTAAVALLLLLIQTARAGYWRGNADARDNQIHNLCEEVDNAREQQELAQKEVRLMREYLQRLHERALLASSEPDMFNELIKANDLLRSLHDVADREGADTNWETLQERLKERLKDQHAMLYAAPVVS